jgi:hypothetical protein
VTVEAVAPSGPAAVVALTVNGDVQLDRLDVFGKYFICGKT